MFSGQKCSSLRLKGICTFALQPACDWLIPPRPHVVGDALADLVAVVKTSLAHRSGLSARQPVTATERKKREEDRRGSQKKQDQVGDRKRDVKSKRE